MSYVLEIFINVDKWELNNTFILSKNIPVDAVYNSITIYFVKPISVFTVISQ